ncbi:MAG: glycosyltransferase family 2 protein [Nitrospirota bacterium]|nr:glycosyltransferase family 2 protein [Nitrospirota bacterium]
MIIYILLPAYNEGKVLEPLLKRIKTGMENRSFNYQVIAYNDGSTDNTLDILKLNKHGIPLKIIGKAQNEGLGFAFFSLIREVIKLSFNEEDIAIVLDSDNTHNPEHVYQMVNKIRDGFDVAIASRYLGDSRTIGVTKLRQILSIGASWMMRILFPIKGVRDYTCGYRAYNVEFLRKAFEKFGNDLVEEKGFACMAELLIKLRSMNILAVEVPLILRYDQKEGESKMEIIKTIKRTILMLLRLKRIK